MSNGVKHEVRIEMVAELNRLYRRLYREFQDYKIETDHYVSNLHDKINKLEDFTAGLDIGGRLNKVRADEMQVRVEELEVKEEV